MKADTLSNRSNSAKKSKLRFLDLSFEGKDLTFKNGELDNGKYPHGGYKGSKKHPMSIYSFDKGKDFQRQLRDDLDQMMEQDMLGVYASPTWAVEAHRWPTHSGESPLLANKFLSPSKFDTLNGTLRPWVKDTGRPARLSAPMAGNNGVQYYRPNRLHQYLSATELRDAADTEEVLRYGRPTRTSLLRARQKVGSPSTNAYETRRQMDHRMDEIKNGCIFSNPKEFIPEHCDVDGESFYSFLTGARYNRAHCLDSKSLTQHGVYMPRNNPLGCFVVGQRGELLDTTSAPPDSPRSDTEEKKSPPIERRRPTTAPGYGRKPLAPMIPTPTPRHAWGDANSDHKKGDDTILEEIRVWSPKLSIKGSRLPLNMSREGPIRFEGRLPSVHGTSLSKLRQLREAMTEDGIICDGNQLPPTPVPTSSKVDNTSLPAVKQEPDLEEKPEEEADIPVDVKEPTVLPAVVPDENKQDDEKMEEKEEEGLKNEGEKETVEKVGEEKVEETESPEIQQPDSNDNATDDHKDDEETQNETTEQASKDKEEAEAADETQAPDGDDIKFFLTEGGKEGDLTRNDDENNGTADDIIKTEDITRKDNSVDDIITTEDKPTPPGDTNTTSVKEESVEYDRLSTTSSKKSKGRRTVTFADKDMAEALTNEGQPNNNPVNDNDDNEGMISDLDGSLASLEEEIMVNNVSNFNSKAPETDDLEGEPNKPVNDNDDNEGTISDLDGSLASLESVITVNTVTNFNSKAPETDDLEQDQGQGHTEPLKVIVTHIEKSMGAPVPEQTKDEEKEEVIAQDP